MILLIGSWNYSRATQRINALVRDCEAARRPFLHDPNEVVQPCDADSLPEFKLIYLEYKVRPLARQIGTERGNRG